MIWLEPPGLHLKYLWGQTSHSQNQGKRLETRWNLFSNLITCNFVYKYLFASNYTCDCVTDGYSSLFKIVINILKTINVVFFSFLFHKTPVFFIINSFSLSMYFKGILFQQKYENLTGIIFYDSLPYIKGTCNIYLQKFTYKWTIYMYKYTSTKNIQLWRNVTLQFVTIHASHKNNFRFLV